MLVANTLLRHLLEGKNFDQQLQSIKPDDEVYLNTVAQIVDNPLPDDYINKKLVRPM